MEGWFILINVFWLAMLALMARDIRKAIERQTRVLEEMRDTKA